MWVLKPEAASPGEILAWDERSGSLKDIRCLEPDAIALEAAAAHGPVKLLAKPQRRGTYSMPETLRPDELEPQLYAQDTFDDPPKGETMDAAL
jgi:hypothetical protein